MKDNATGVLKFIGNGRWVLCNLELFQRNDAFEILISNEIVKRYKLPEGVVMNGPVKKNGNVQELIAVDTVCGLPPEEFEKRTPYRDLIAINPAERFKFTETGDESLRIIDLIAPIGKGTRGLIVSPPKAGKTVMLEKLANGINLVTPNTRIIVLLIDERPEEVTHFKKSVNAEVIASSSDQSIEEHVELVELTLKHVTIELECGCDVVVLVDSLTRMGRAFNLKGAGTGRIMSGGLEVGALEIPRRFFGIARNIEGGGSVTIIATVLIDTGSRMDQLIFEEFKGTGNSEIVLDRKLAEERIFPAINIAASGTRREELLYSSGEIEKINALRRVLSSMDSKEMINEMKKIISRYPTNNDLLQNISSGNK